MFAYTADGAWPSLPPGWQPEPKPHQYGPDGTCWKCTVHFLDATTSRCPGIRPA